MPSTATVVMLPSEDTERTAVLEALRSQGATVIDVDVDLTSADPAPLSVRVCAAIISAQPEPPLLIVAFADAAHLMPAVALAQRTAHRAVAGYVLIDPETDPSAPEWPDAPVLVVATDANSPGLNRARLRGWSMSTVESSTQLANRVIAAATP